MKKFMYLFILSLVLFQVNPSLAAPSDYTWNVDIPVLATAGSIYSHSAVVVGSNIVVSYQQSTNYWCNVSTFDGTSWSAQNTLYQGASATDIRTFKITHNGTHYATGGVFQDNDSLAFGISDSLATLKLTNLTVAGYTTEYAYEYCANVAMNGSDVYFGYTNKTAGYYRPSIIKIVNGVDVQAPVYLSDFGHAVTFSDLKCFDNKLYAVISDYGGDPTNTTIWTSTDGATWTLEPTFGVIANHDVKYAYLQIEDDQIFTVYSNFSTLDIMFMKGTVSGGWDEGTLQNTGADRDTTDYGAGDFVVAANGSVFFFYRHVDNIPLLMGYSSQDVTVSEFSIWVLLPVLSFVCLVMVLISRRRY